MTRIDEGEARAPFAIGDTVIAPGARRTVDIPVGVLSNHTPVNLSVHVVHGARPGPVLFVSAALHGDEVLGVEVIRRLLRRPDLGALAGTLLAVPVVNAFGFLAQSRYLPDRRDLNRSFPGGASGSLSAQLAHLFMQEIVRRSTLGIDIHTAAVHRVNLPHIRVGAASEGLMRLATVFGAPVGLVGGFVDGSMRLAAKAANVEVLLYEAGEALRFDEFAVRIGLKGVVNVMRALAMLPEAPDEPPGPPTPYFLTASRWIRAPTGGILRALVRTGDAVADGGLLGYVSDPFGESEIAIRAKRGGVVLSRTNLPIVNGGDALFHIAFSDDEAAIGERIDTLERDVLGDPLMNEEDRLL